jgi:limonene-1,2-epoxide hydrolase
MNRRNAIVLGGFGIVGNLAVGSARGESTAAEKANMQLVNNFCAAWPSHDVDKLMSFFSDPCAYRMTETQEPARGRDAVSARIKGIVDRVERFEVLDSFAKGPMVINERVDHFTGGPLRSWHGVGVFFLKDGKIVEWYDYTISMERA